MPGAYLMGTRAFVLFLLASASALGSPVDTARMDEVVKSYSDRKRFMGSVLLARGDEVLFSKGYGFANAEWEIPNSPSTKFRLGSVTKQFTAACILLLEERGKLKTSDRVKKYLPDAPAAWDNITIHNLLTHTSGIPNFTSFPDYGTIKLSPSTPGQSYERFKDKSLDFQPGEKFSYSNSNYLLLGYLIEKISGESYEKFLRQNVLAPLALKDTGYDSRALIPRRASGYSRSGEEIANADYIDMTIPHAAGALYSTTEDLLRWEQGLFAGKLLSAASLKKMTTPFKETYAYGLDVRTMDGHKVISHGGGIEGFNSFLAYHPEDRLTVVVLANLSGPAANDLATKLAAIARGEKVVLQSERQTIELAPKVLEAYAGRYELRPGLEMVVTLESGQLMTQMTGQRKIAVFAESETRFFPKVVDAEMEFFKDESGKVTHLVLSQGGRHRQWVRK